MGTRPGIDCHNHVIDPVRFPFAPHGGYRPLPDEIGTREAFVAVLDVHDMRHALLVQPSCYGTDNRAALDAIAWQSSRFKLIGVLDPGTSERELEILQGQGMVGVRFNLPYNPEALTDSAAGPFLKRLRGKGWFLQIHGQDADWVRVAPIL
jgi:predicted TIM-barrel fold metal-dependent hydrolase